MVFDPRFQRVELHLLRLLRPGASPIDFLQRERMRLLQREARLENLVMDGVWTLLAVLDDVRPGDVLETAFSLVGGHPVKDNACDVFFAPPPNLELKDYRLRVHLAQDRPGVRWKSSAAIAEPVETMEDDLRVLTWSGTQPVAREPEDGTAFGVMDYDWIQVSDWKDWNELSRTVANQWARVPDDWPERESRQDVEPPNATAALKLLEDLQAEVRYLSVDLGQGGWVPSSPGAVLRRRYGDCKDLSHLAARRLAAHGITARPVLVGTGLRGAVRDLLPSCHLFNHAILELEVEGRQRWFDLTMRNQGGDLWSRAVEWFDAGLPLNEAGAELVAQPGRQGRSKYELSETILTDTRRNRSSCIEIRLRCEGIQADMLRHQRIMQGPEEFSRQRELAAQQRFGAKTRREGNIEWRDSPTDNVCELVETFKTSGMFFSRSGDSRAIMTAPGCLLWAAFPMPPDKPRRTSWHVNYPLEIEHTITIHSDSMMKGKDRRRSFTAGPIDLEIHETYNRGSWSKLYCGVSKTDRVEVQATDDYRRMLEQVYDQTGWEVLLPWDAGRVSEPASWGRLAKPSRIMERDIDRLDHTASESFAKIGHNSRERTARERPRTERRRRRRDNNDGEVPVWPIVFTIIVVVKIVVFILLRV